MPWAGLPIVSHVIQWGDHIVSNTQRSQRQRATVSELRVSRGTARCYRVSIISHVPLKQKEHRHTRLINSGNTVSIDKAVLVQNTHPDNNPTPDCQLHFQSQHQS